MLQSVAPPYSLHSASCFNAWCNEFGGRVRRVQTPSSRSPPNDTTTGGPALRHTLFVNPKSGSGTGDDRLDAALAALPDAEVVRIEPGIDLGRHVDAAI